MQDLMIGQENYGKIESLSDSNIEVKQEEDDIQSRVVVNNQNTVNQDQVNEAMKELQLDFENNNSEQGNSLRKRLQKVSLSKRRQEDREKRDQRLLQAQQKIEQSKKEQQLQLKIEQLEQQLQKTEQNQQQKQQIEQQIQKVKEERIFQQQQNQQIGQEYGLIFQDEQKHKKQRKQIKTKYNFTKEDQSLITGTPLNLGSVIQDKLYFFLINIQYPDNQSPLDANYVDLLGKVLVHKNNSQQARFSKNSLTQSCLIRIQNLQKEILVEINQHFENQFLQENVDLNDKTISEFDFYQQFGKIIEEQDSQIPVRFEQQNIWTSNLLNKDVCEQFILKLRQTLKEIFKIEQKDIQVRPVIKIRLQDPEQRRRLFFQVLIPGQCKVNSDTLKLIRNTQNSIQQVLLENTPIVNFIINKQLQVDCWYSINQFQEQEVRPQFDDFTKCKIKRVFTANRTSQIQKLPQNTEKPDYSKLYIDYKKDGNNKFVCISCMYEYQNYKKFYLIGNLQDRQLRIADTLGEYQYLQCENNRGQFQDKYNNVYELQIYKARENWMFAEKLSKVFADCQADVVIGDNLRAQNDIMIGQLKEKYNSIRVMTQNINYYSFNYQNRQQGLMQGTRFTLFSLAQILDFNKMLQELAPDDKEFSLEYQAKINQLCDEQFQWLSVEDISFGLEKSLDFQKPIIENQCQEVFMMGELSKQLNAVELFAQISHLTFMPLQETFIYGRAKRNAQLLNMVFSNMIFVSPGEIHISSEDFKQEQVEQDQESKGAQYEGGRVIDPIKGFHTNCIIVLDYNSLYPSIIREYSICYTNIQQISNPTYGLIDQGEKIQLSEDQQKQYPFKSVLPKIVTYLLQTRKQVKKQISQIQNSEDPNELEIQSLNVKQLAFKLIANSMYGCLGFSNSNYKNLILASKITRLGRQALGIAEKVVLQHNLKIIYGDTDSIMIDSNIDLFSLLQNNKEFKKSKRQVLSLATQLSKEISDNFDFLKIDLDYIFLRQLLTNKKRYASIKLLDNDTIRFEYKGLDLVRRDWCQISRKMQKDVIEKILKEGEATGTESVISYLKEINYRLTTPNILKSLPWELFKMTKMLNKALNQYKDVKGMDHVICAQFMEYQNKVVRSGQVIEYLLVKRDYAPKWLQDKYPNEKSLPVPFYYHEVLDQNGFTKNISLDIEFYIKQQIIPPIERITCFIESLNGQVAQVFGYESTNVNFEYQQNNEGFVQPIFSEMYKDCKPITFEIQGKKHIWPRSLESQSNQYRGKNIDRFSPTFSPGDWLSEVQKENVLIYMQEVRRRLLRLQYQLQHNSTICINPECKLYQLPLDDMIQETEDGQKYCPCCRQIPTTQYNVRDIMIELFYLIHIHDTDGVYYGNQPLKLTDPYVQEGQILLSQISQTIKDIQQNYNLGIIYLQNEANVSNI